MNDKLEAFRKRLRGPDKKTNWQFWIGSPTAWLALLISSTTAFFSLLYHSDELSVVLDHQYTSYVKDAFRIGSPKPITFINSGSRPIAVLNIQLVYVQPTSDPKKFDCLNGHLTIFELAFDQFVVKPYDILTREVRFEDAKFQDVPFAGMNKGLLPDGLTQPNIIVCLSAEIVVTNMPRWRKTTMIVRAVEPEEREITPAYLIKRSTFWTAVGSDPGWSRIDLHRATRFDMRNARTE